MRNFWADHQKRRTAAWVVGALAVFLLIFGVYVFLEAHQTYTELNAKAEALGPPSDPTDASNVLFAMMLRDRDRAEARRWQGVMWVGISLMGLAAAYMLKPTDAVE